MELVLSLFLGASLAACAGLRAFLPLFVLGLAFRFELVGGFALSEGFGWLTSTPALVCLGTATLLEMAADKIPVVDSALDSVQTFVRPGAGALSVLAVLSTDHHLVAYCVAVIFGGVVSLPVHMASSALRVGSTVTTGGLANPLLSMKEDFIAAGGSVLALFMPILAFFCLSTALYLLFRVLRGLRDLLFWRRRREASA